MNNSPVDTRSLIERADDLIARLKADIASLEATLRGEDR